MKQQELSDDGAEVVAALASRLAKELGDFANVHLRYDDKSQVADLLVTPTAPGGLHFSVVGLTREFVVSIGKSRWRRAEIANTPDGVVRLNRLVTAAVEGRGWGKQVRHTPYR